MTNLISAASNLVANRASKAERSSWNISSFETHDRHAAIAQISPKSFNKQLHMKTLKFYKNLVLRTVGAMAFVFLLGCEDEHRSMESIEAEKKKAKIANEEKQGSGNATMQEMMVEIKAMSESVTCTDPSKWKYMPIGSKPCGGPMGFIAYSIEIDVQKFEKKVKAYSEAQRLYNINTGAVSDCSLPIPPKMIVCENGKPVLIYK